MPKKRRGQAWSFDLIIASFLFIIGILGLYLYFINTPQQGQDETDSLFYEGNIIGSIILTEGFPLDWNISSVTRIGILTDGKINETKLAMFAELAQNNYDMTRNLLRTTYNYYIFFPDNITLPTQINGIDTGLPTEIEGIGKPASNPKNLITITRYVIYKDKPTTLKIHIWE